MRFMLKNSFPSPHREQIFRLLGNKKRGFASYSKLEKKQTLFVYDVVQMIATITRQQVGTVERALQIFMKLGLVEMCIRDRARRLVHECCNYDEGNCLLLDDGEPCVCVQSISLSLMCRWFRVAVLPLDGELAAALLYRGSRKRCAVCGAAFVPKSNRGKYCPDVYKRQG